LALIVKDVKVKVQVIMENLKLAQDTMESSYARRSNLGDGRVS
jgi:hypothetical protein